MLEWLYVAFAAWLLLSISFRKRLVFFDSRLMVEAGFLVYYAIPGIRHAAPTIFNYISGPELLYGYTFNATYKAFFCVLLFYLCYVFAHDVALSKRKTSRFELFMHNEKKKVFDIARVIMIVSGILFLIYCSFFGGFMELMSNISRIRGGLIESTEGRFSFINKLYRCAPFAVYLTIDYWRNKKYRRLIIALFIFNFVIVISYGGRGILLQFIGVLFAGNYIYRKTISHKRYQTRKIATIIGISIFVLVIYRPLLIAAGNIKTNGLAYAARYFLDTLNESSRYNASSISSILSSVLRSTDHYSISLETSIQMVDAGVHQCRYFFEWIIDFLSMIPSMLLNISKLPSITYFNSMYISGSASIAQIPSGIIGEAYYTGGIIWVAFYGLLFGVIGKKIDEFYLDIKRCIGFASTYYFALLFFYFGFAVGGDFASLLQKGMTTFLVIYLVRLKMRRRKAVIQ